MSLFKSASYGDIVDRSIPWDGSEPTLELAENDLIRLERVLFEYGDDPDVAWVCDIARNLVK